MEGILVVDLAETVDIVDDEAGQAVATRLP
jgi:hypothetical protein